MNTLPCSVPSLLLQYADDTTLICSGSISAAAACIMNQQLALIHDWLVKHRIKLNVRPGLCGFTIKDKKVAVLSMHHYR